MKSKYEMEVENFRSKFADIKKALSDFEVNKDNIETAKELIEVLKSDKRKNVISIGIKYEKSMEKYNKEVERVKLLYEFDIFTNYSSSCC